MTKPNRSLNSTSTTSRRLVVVIAAVALLIGSCVATAGVALADTALVDLDENTELTDRSTHDEYASAGVATVDVAAPDLEIGIAEEHEDLGVDGFHNDYAYDWLRIRYNEDIDRDIRFYVPSAYWSPYFDESVDAVDGDMTAKFVPVDGGAFTAVRLSFDGPTTVVFPVSATSGTTWSFWSDQDDRIEDATGVSSGIDGSEQWNYVGDSEWSNGTLVVENVSNPDRVLIQYDGEVSDESELWLKVPEGQSSRAPVYYFERSSDGNASTIVVVSEKDDPPAVRMKRSSTTQDGLSSVLNDWSQMPDRIGAFVDSLFGSGEDE